MKKLSQFELELFGDTKQPIRQPIVEALKNALREELNAWYGYVIVKEFLVGPERVNIQKFYEDTAKDELEDHAYWIMERISQLGGEISDISMSPCNWQDADHEYLQPMWISGGVPVRESLITNIKNEEGAIDTYKKLVFVTEDIDPITNCKAKEILADETEHLQELKDFLNDINSQNGIATEIATEIP